jgi:hypothetical protein
MNCEQVTTLLDDYVDGALEREDEAHIRRHLAGCDSCRHVERGLRALLESTATLPESIDPPRDLWPAIDGRLDRIDRTRPTRRSRPIVGGRAWASGLLAASLLLAGVGAGYLLRGPGQPTAVTPADPGSRQMLSSAAEIIAAEQAIVVAKGQLQTLLEEQDKALSPETVRMVHDNLAVIDEAIEEIRAAPLQDPANQRLNRKLLTAHRRQLHLLQRATQIAARGSRSDTI